MGQSGLSVVNLVILITASAVVHMNGIDQPSSTDVQSTRQDIQTTETSESSAVTADDITDNVDHSVSVTTDNALNNEFTSAVYSHKNESTDAMNNTSDGPFTNGSDQGGGGRGPPEPLYRSFAEYDLFRFLIDHVHWVNAFPGIILNPLCVYVTIIMKPFNPTSLLMVTLAITDFTVVLTRFVYINLEDIILTNFECSLCWGLIHAMLAYSNFILVVWTLERTLAVRFPLKVTSWCSMRNIKIALGVALIVACGLSIPYFMHMKVSTFGGCEFAEFIQENWSYVDNGYYVWMPMFIIIVSNGIILYTMRKTTKAHAAMTQNTEAIEKRERDQRKLTIVLLAICASFIIYHIPQIILVVIDDIYPDAFVLYDDQHAFIQLIAYQQLGYEFTLLQNNFNFVLYCSTGAKFRHTLMRVICFWRSRQQALDDSAIGRTRVYFVSKSA